VGGWEFFSSPLCPE